jgi:hypothetical protein
VWGLLVFVVLLMFGCISVVVVEVACLGLCKVDVVGWSASDECVGGRGSLVTG